MSAWRRGRRGCFDADPLPSPAAFFAGSLGFRFPLRVRAFARDEAARCSSEIRFAITDESFPAMLSCKNGARFSTFDIRHWTFGNDRNLWLDRHRRRTSSVECRMSPHGEIMRFMRFVVPALLALLALPLYAQRTQKPPLHGRHWMAITGKPLAATAGGMIFQKGGNAVDAAAAMLAATCTMWDTLGWGGETQALIYNPRTKKVIGINALGVARSEEHTSELQSQSNLVCRLLLEKKNKPLHLTQ